MRLAATEDRERLTQVMSEHAREEYESLAPEIRRELQKTFMEMDRDGSGAITRDELQAYITAHGWDFSIPSYVWAVADLDGNGKLSFYEVGGLLILMRACTCAKCGMYILGEHLWVCKTCCGRLAGLPLDQQRLHAPTMWVSICTSCAKIGPDDERASRPQIISGFTFSHDHRMELVRNEWPRPQLEWSLMPQQKAGPRKASSSPNSTSSSSASASSDSRTWGMPPSPMPCGTTAQTAAADSSSGFWDKVNEFAEAVNNGVQAADTLNQLADVGRELVGAGCSIM